MIIYQENLHHAKELQKQAHDKGVKSWSYAPGKKIWFNNKYIKTKHNRKLEAKFFRPFQVLHPVGKQAYKLELLRSGESMMFSMCHYWNKTLQGRGGYMRRTRRNWTPVIIARNTRWKQFGTARSMQKSQNRVTYQAFTTWCFGKGIQKKKIPGSQPQRFSTLESSSACSIRTTLTSRRRLLLQSTPHHRWLDQPSFSSGKNDD